MRMPHGFAAQEDLREHASEISCRSNCCDIAERIEARVANLVPANTVGGQVSTANCKAQAGLQVQVEGRDEDAFHEARRLSLLKEVHQQRQEEQERERQRTQQLKTTLAEAVNASRERFNAAHANGHFNPMRSDGLRSSDHDVVGMRENGNVARLCQFRSAAAAVSAGSSSATGSRSQPSRHQMRSGTWQGCRRSYRSTARLSCTAW